MRLLGLARHRPANAAQRRIRLLARLSLLVCVVVSLLFGAGGGLGGPLGTAGPSPAAAAATGPLLLVTNPAAPNKFGPYLGELLRAEGFNGFLAADLATVTPALLAVYSTVLLAETPLTPTQATTFTDFVSTGGTLIAMRPDPQLFPVLGITAAGTGPTTNGFFLVNTAHPAGAGIANLTLQFKGDASHYTLSGASSVGTLYTGISTATTRP